jgi:type IV secretory pathway VirB2 component (pilin)
MVRYQASLFEAPPEPVAAAGNDWVTGLIGGSLAVSLCVIAMAILGTLMLSGRLHIRRGLQVILGCFLLLGSNALASGLAGLAGDDAGAQPNIIVPPQPTVTPLPPVTQDPYSGASLRRD